MKKLSTPELQALGVDACRTYLLSAWIPCDDIDAMDDLIAIHNEHFDSVVPTALPIYEKREGRGLLQCARVGCFRSEDGSLENAFQRCSGCKAPCYCGVECQRLHWTSGHKAVCKKKRDDLMAKIFGGMEGVL